MRPVQMTFFCAVLALPLTSPLAAQREMYWGNEVPAEWTGDWPANLLTVAEKSDFTRTMTVEDLHEFIHEIKWKSENLHVIDIFVSPLGHVSPAIVLASPRVTSPVEAQGSGKPVIYLQGNIHPPEPEGGEALLILAREILFGDRAHLLDNQIVIMAPILNVDGSSTRGVRDEVPYFAGQRMNARGIDLNRDAVKLETVEFNGLFETILNPWDPILIYDSHRMRRGNFAYAIAYVNSTVPAAHPGPRTYVRDVLFPAVRESLRKEFGLEAFTHALWPGADWPPEVWSHNETIYSTEAKFLANAYGLRNRMSILAETPGAADFERRIYSQYAYLTSLLEYTNDHAADMQRVADEADRETVEAVLEGAEDGSLRNWLEGRYESRGTIDLLAYREAYPVVDTIYLSGTSVQAPDRPTGPPEVVHGIEDLTKPVGTRDEWMPRGYLLPPSMGDVAGKLRQHRIEVVQLREPMTAAGQEFVVERLYQRGGPWYAMTALEGTFRDAVRDFPPGSYFVDMAQFMANAAFYFLEPQSADGFVGWGVLNDTLHDLAQDGMPFEYPIFKYRRQVGGG